MYTKKHLCCLLLLVFAHMPLVEASAQAKRIKLTVEGWGIAIDTTFFLSDASTVADLLQEANVAMCEEGESLKITSHPDARINTTLFQSSAEYLAAPLYAHGITDGPLTVELLQDREYIPFPPQGPEDEEASPPNPDEAVFNPGEDPPAPTQQSKTGVIRASLVILAGIVGAVVVMTYFYQKRRRRRPPAPSASRAKPHRPSKTRQTTSA